MVLSLLLLAPTLLDLVGTFLKEDVLLLPPLLFGGDCHNDSRSVRKHKEQQEH